MGNVKVEHYQQALWEFLKIHGGRLNPSRQLTSVSYDWIETRARELARAEQEKQE